MELTTAIEARGAHLHGSAYETGIGAFDTEFVRLFDEHFARVFRVLDRLSGDPELAADLAQDAFVRLYRRGAAPQRPEAWLITVALNLLRNARAKQRRRLRLLTVGRGTDAHSEPIPQPGAQAEAEAAHLRARAALDRLPAREQQLLILHAEGYGYRDIATAVAVKETGVGTLIARARDAFKAAYEETGHDT